MPRTLQETDIDPIAEQVDMDMLETGEVVAPPVHAFSPDQRVDLHDGGNLGGVRVVPLGDSGRIEFDRAKREPGRPTTRMAWTWDGRATELPLAWTPSGKQHDGARKYLLKRHCMVCNFAGFYGNVCPACRKAGRPQRPGSITPAYYLKKSQVPNPLQPFGSVDCFVRACPRRGEYGFHADIEMRQHAASRHRAEYRAYQEAATANAKTEVDLLREQINAMMAGGRMMSQAPAPAPVAAPVEAQASPARVRTEKEREAARARMARIREAKKQQEPA